MTRTSKPGGCRNRRTDDLAEIMRHEEFTEYMRLEAREDELDIETQAVRKRMLRMRINARRRHAAKLKRQQ
jgi:hypothetical protein